MGKNGPVIVDGRLARRRRTGVATYIHELDAALRETAGGGPPVRVVFGPPGLPRRGRLTGLGNLLIDLLWLHVALPAIALRAGARAIHAPVNWAPWWSPCPVIVTVQDVAWERLPAAYPARFRRYAQIFTHRSVRVASAVLTTSTATARDLIELYGVPAERIRVIPIGVRPGADLALERSPFVLYVGEFEPRKRVLELIEGHRRYYRAAPPSPPPCRLILAGSGGSQHAAAAAAAADECQMIGFVDAARRDRLYREATLLVMPSAYEGFGLPVAEAMIRGCPTLVAANSSLPEVGGASALLMDASDPGAIAAALADALADREGLAARGRAGRVDAAARFSWPAIAAQIRGVYREVAA